MFPCSIGVLQATSCTISLNEMTNLKVPAWCLAHGRPPRNVLFLSPSPFCFIPCCPCFLSEVVLEGHPAWHAHTGFWTNEHNALLPMNQLAGPMNIMLYCQQQVIPAPAQGSSLGARLFTLGCQAAMLMHFAPPPPTTINSTNGTLVYSRER